VIGAVLWLGALAGGVWALERMRKRRGDMTSSKRRKR
jgi:hypothetical protein